MSDHKNVIVQFKKTALSEEKDTIIQELKNQGAQIIKTENKDSKILPFIVASMPDAHLSTLQSAAANGHDTIQNVEEDGEMHIQA